MGGSVLISLRWRNWGGLAIGGWCLLGLLWAQPGGYHRLQVAGSLPPDFLPGGPVAPRDSLATPAFMARSRYQMQQLLHSGHVLFGDSISAYLQAVGAVLLGPGEAAVPLRFYAVRRSSANAFASPEGIVLVHLGLLAQVQSEAELAFVLSHEISHYLAGHARQRAARAAPGKVPGRFDRPEPEETAQQFSQAQEIAADSAGLRRYLAAGYAPAAALRVLSRLRQPVGDSLRTGLDWLAEVVPTFPAAALAGADTAASFPPVPPPLLHPSPEVREARIAEALAGQAPGGAGQRVDRSGGRFRQAQRRARQALALLLLEEQAYAQALYVSGNGYPLPPAYQRWVRLRACYSLAIYHNGGRFWDVHREAGSVPGAARLVYAQCEQLSGAELTVLALAMSWQWRDSLTRPGEGQALARHLWAEIDRYYPELLTDSSAWTGRTLARLRRQPGFAMLAQPRDTPAPEVATSETAALAGFSLGIDRAVLVDPVFQEIDDRGAWPVLQYEASTRAERRWTRLLSRQAQLVGLDHALLTPQKLISSDTAVFRDLSLLQAWFAERSALDELEMVSLYQAEVVRLSQRYGTPFFVWMGGIAFKRRRSGKAMMAAMGIFPPFLPYSLYYLFTPHYDTLIYLLVYDLPQGQYRLIYPRLIQMRNKPDVLRSVTYDLLWQVRRHP
jgi:beta-barrel assembly-enhancing protease